MTKSTDIAGEVQLLEAVFEYAIDAKIIFDTKNRIVKANNQAEVLFNLNNYRNKNIYKFLTKEVGGYLRILLNKKENTTQASHELEIKLNNKINYYDISVATILFGRFRILVFRNVSEKVLDKQSRDQFLAIAGHEIKTPLTVIQSYVDLLDRKTHKNSGTKKYLKKINEKILILANYVNSIVDEIKIGTGKLEFNDKTENLDVIIREAVIEIQTVYPSRKLHLVGETKRFVFVDKQRISQVVSNLVHNAYKYSKEHSSVTIIISDKKDYVLVEIVDKGKGISKNEQAKIFKAFYRSSDNASGQTGLGLGLYISSKIINRYGGVLDVKSTLGKGSTFYFTLPVHFP